MTPPNPTESTALMLSKNGSTSKHDLNEHSGNKRDSIAVTIETSEFHHSHGTTNDNIDYEGDGRTALPFFNFSNHHRVQRPRDQIVLISSLFVVLCCMYVFLFQDGASSWIGTTSKVSAAAFMDISGNEWTNTITEKFEQVTQSGMLQKLTYGVLCGFFSGFALKRVGKFIAVMIGLVFILLQVLSYYGYISVNQDKVTDDVQNLFSSDTFVQGLQGIQQKTMNVLSYNLPAAGGFGAGFLLGFKIG